MGKEEMSGKIDRERIICRLRTLRDAVYEPGICTGGIVCCVAHLYNILLSDKNYNLIP
jgi:hypothetical protein